MALGLAGLLWAVAALALAIVACGRDTADPVTVTAVDELIRVGFLAQTEGGELAPAKGRPDLILEWNGKAKLRLMGESGYEYLDPLAIESDLVGEHPSEKLERLHRRFGVPMDKALARKLKDAQRSQLLFHSVEFEYLPGKQTTGMIAEVFPDGSFLVIPGQLPDEWMSDSRRTASPSHFLIDARGLISASFEIARAYEQEILALPLR